MKAARASGYILNGVIPLMISAALHAAEPNQSAFADAYALSLQELEDYRKTGFLVGVVASPATREAITKAWELGKQTTTDPLVLAELAANYGGITRDTAEAKAAVEYAIALMEAYLVQNNATEALIRPLMSLGYLNYEFDGLLGAQKYFRKAFRLADDYWKGELRLADLYLEAGVKLSLHSHLTGRRYMESALEIYGSLPGEQALEGSAATQMHLGRFWIRRGADALAEKHLLAGLSILGNSPAGSATFLGLHAQLARVYANMHKPELAARHNRIIGSTYTGAANNQLVPLYTVAPRYPRNARRLNITGHVTLSFTVNELGEVVNPVVVERSGHHEFEYAAKNVASQIRYAPRFVNGSAVATDDVQFTYEFKIFE